MYHASPSDKPKEPKPPRWGLGSRDDDDDNEPSLSQRGNIKPRDRDGDHRSTARDAAEGKTESPNTEVAGQTLSNIDGLDADDVPPRGMGRSRGSRPRKIRPPSASAARSSSNEEPMIDDNRAYRKDYRLECELYDEDADEEPDPYEDEPNLLQIGNIKPRDLDGDHCFITREVAEGEAESRNTGDVGQALSNIDGFSADDVPQWDGEE